VGFFTGLVGLDRIALSRFLQAQKARVEIMPSAEALAEGLRTHRLDAAWASLESVFLALTGRELRDQAVGKRERTYAFGRRGGEHTR
jgi:hypothetical protein